MSKKEKEFRVWMGKMVKKYSVLLKLTQHFVTFVKKDIDNYFEVTLRYPYLDPIIYYSDETINDWVKDKKTAERNVIHELCHLVTTPLYCKATNRFVSKNELDDERELLTDYFTNIIYDLIHE